MRIMKVTGGLLAALLAISIAGVGTAQAAKKAAKKGPGLCGTFMYWKGAKCMDARDKK